MKETPSNTTVVVEARGEIDIETAPSLDLELAAALKTHPEVVLDLSRVTFMDCSGLRVLDHARLLANLHDSRLLLRGAGPSVLRLLELTRRAATSLSTPEPPLLTRPGQRKETP